MKTESGKELLSYPLELMDWKEVEGQSERVIAETKKQMVIAEILLANAKIKIHQLGGKTNEDIDAEAKARTV
jgi:hypothetical protein